MRTRIRAAEEAVREAFERMEAALAALENSPRGASLERLQRAFDDAEADHASEVETLDRYRAVSEARENLPVAPADEERTPENDPVRGNGRARVTGEPLTYQRGGPNSLFRDLLLADKGNLAASERLQRHSREMVEHGQRVEQRDLSSTDAAGGYLVPPLWLQEEFVSLARAGRVVANVIGSRDLPPNTDSINLPRMSSGTAVADQADNASVQKTDAAFDTIAADVKTIAGLQDASLQLVDRSLPGVDEVIFADLARAYHVQLDSQVINSSTTNNKGLLQVSGTNSVTFTSGSPTLPLLYSKIADGIRQINEGVFLPPTAVFMAPRRWAWCLASLDSQNRPLIVPNAITGDPGSFGGDVESVNPAGTQGAVIAEGAVGSIQGLPVYVDSNIPSTLGAGTNEDRVIVARVPDLYLWEDAAGPYLETFRDVLSGTLQVRFRLHSYWSQLHARRPKSISVVSGSGLASPSF